MWRSVIAFKKSSAPEISAPTPEKLFPRLARTGYNSDSLWSQQTDLLREYANKRSTARDLAVELPTGTGKTLTGLLIADWRRREGKGRAVFACPTRQLVRQVVDAAGQEGIPVVDLSGSFADWSPQAKASYERERATAVVTYSTIFNSSPKLIEADVIVFDDAHAGEQYVSKAYTVEVSRQRHNEIYSAVLEAVRPVLSDERYNQLISNAPGAGTRQLVDALTLAQREDWLAGIGRALSDFSRRPANDVAARSAKYAYGAISEHLSACTLYLSWNKVEIRPATPPTFENHLFSSANQRVYLSATMGSAGELERAFGRPAVKRLALPLEAPTPKSGRRFLVFPHLVPDCDPNALTRELIEMAGKAIVITPSDQIASDAKELIPEGWEQFGKQNIAESLVPFSEAEEAVAILANRYDGIDLPGDACRAVVMYGYPGVTNQQEKFYATRARAAAVSDERVRTRVVQGIGRCTRGPRDWALVIVADPETTTYLTRAEVHTTLSPDFQAEILFGLDQSEASADNVRENVEAFLEQGDLWRESAEPEITRLTANAARVVPSSAAPLAAAARLEVEALESLWHEDWESAALKTHGAATELSSSNDARGYRATLLFRAAVFMEKAARSTGQEQHSRTADAFAAEAVAAATPSTWMNAFLPFPGRQPAIPSASLTSAATALSSYVKGFSTLTKLRLALDKLTEGLASVDHEDYEPALTQLGALLGASAFKPAGDGRTDSAWCWDNHLWLTLEAKSEHKPTGTIGVDDVRQVNGHLSLVASDRGVPVPADSAAVVISPRTLVHRDAMTLAGQNTWRVTPSEIQGIAAETERLWDVLHPLRNIPLAEDRVEAIMLTLQKARLTPEDIRDRLTGVPLGAG